MFTSIFETLGGKYVIPPSLLRKLRLRKGKSLSQGFQTEKAELGSFYCCVQQLPMSSAHAPESLRLQQESLLHPTKYEASPLFSPWTGQVSLTSAGLVVQGSPQQDRVHQLVLGLGLGEGLGEWQVGDLGPSGDGEKLLAVARVPSGDECITCMCVQYVCIHVCLQCVCSTYSMCIHACV